MDNKGLSSVDTDSLVVTSNLFYKNSTTTTPELDILTNATSAAPIIANNILMGNGLNTAIACNKSSDTLDVDFLNNNIFNTGGITAAGCQGFSMGSQGNISEDPLMLNPDGNSFHLLSGSPSIDSGLNSVLGIPSSDIDGNPRIVDGDLDGSVIIDQGAYESSQSGTLVFYDDYLEISESGGAVTTMVCRVGGSQGPLSIDLITNDDTAISGVHYNSASFVVNFADSETGCKNYTFDLIDNSSISSDVRLSLSLSNLSQGMLTRGSVSRYLVQNDDYDVSVAIFNLFDGYSIDETVQFHVSLSNLGAELARNVPVEFNIPETLDNVSLIYADDNGFTGENSEYVTCSVFSTRVSCLANVPDDINLSIQVSSTAVEVGSSQLIATANGPDINSLNNSAVKSLNIYEGYDVSVTVGGLGNGTEVLGATPIQVVENNAFVTFVNVSNSDVVHANVAWSFNNPPGVTINTLGGYFLEPGQGGLPRLEITGNEVGVYEVEYEVSGDGIDIDPTNNRGVITVSVIPEVTPDQLRSEILFPLIKGARWDYGFDEQVRTSRVLFNERIINSESTIGIVDNEGDVEYYTNDSRGLLDYGNVSLITGESLIATPPLKILNPIVNIGDEIITNGVLKSTISGANGTYPYTSTSKITGIQTLQHENKQYSAVCGEIEIVIPGLITNREGFCFSPDIGEVSELKNYYLPPKITTLSPINGTTLTSDIVTVNWDAMGSGVDNFAVRAGNTGAGSYNLAVPPFSGANATSETLSGLPTDGSPFTISLYAMINGKWTVMDSQDVTAFTAPQPAITTLTPINGTTLTGSSVTVNWDAMGAAVQNFAVRAGNTGAGSYNLAVPPFSGANATSETLSGLPTDGSPFTISLYAMINGKWVVMDSQDVTAFTAPQPAITTLSPINGTTLTGSSVMVNWDAMGTAVQNFAVRAGNTGAGSYNLAVPPFSGANATSETLNGLPTDGSSFTISLYAMINGKWTVMDSLDVTAFTAPQPAITTLSPINGTTLTGSSVTVNWDAMGTAVQNFAVRAGNTGAGSYNLAVPPFSGANATSETLSGLPTDGSPFTISLYAMINGKWVVMDSQDVTAFTAPQPAITTLTPINGTTLTGSSVTVNWDAMGAAVQNFAVRAGNTGAGSYNLAVPPFSGANATSETLSGLPTDGSPFTISLYAMINGKWVVMDSQDVTAFTAPQPAITTLTPINGTTLTGSSVTVNWDAMGAAVQNFAVRAGNTGAGSYNLAVPPFSGANATSETLSGLPTDGSPFTISLYAMINGKWTVMDSQDVTAFTAPFL